MANKGKLTVSLLIGGLLAALEPGAARAADAQENVVQPVNEWRFAIAPYFWAAGMNGDVGLFGREPVPLDMSFGDIFDDLRFGGMLVAEAHNGTWGLFGDLIYAKTESDTTITRTVAAVPTSLSATLETSSFTGTLMGEYRIYGSGTVSLDVMAGARIWSVDNDINAVVAASGVPVAEWSGSDGATWVDPMIGLKARFETATPWFFNAWGMMGTGSSDISWDVLAGAGYQWTDKVSLVAGYRALGVDYNDDGFVYDMVQHGPYTGLIFGF
ncbi:MAG: hypothetical protein JNK47_00445 [Mesorhizobium sp.]|nr:hypothetical protein [Mesorhizobium sp.]MBL8575666.1 hypothetical protein [Mesorhizobium sp.]